jgi:hypothetical protein
MLVLTGDNHMAAIYALIAIFVLFAALNFAEYGRLD